jgi:hypothetical protein
MDLASSGQFDNINQIIQSTVFYQKAYLLLKWFWDCLVLDLLVQVLS